MQTPGYCSCLRLRISIEFGYIFRHRGIFKDYDQGNIVEKKQNIHFVLKVSSFMLSSIFFSNKLESGRLIFQYKYLLPFHCRLIIDLLLARVGISHLITWNYLHFIPQIDQLEYYSPITTYHPLKTISQKNILCVLKLSPSCGIV